MGEERLLVRCRGRLVGTIDADPTGRMGFRYDASWLDGKEPFPISLSLPLGRDPFSDERAHGFFANLLPEGTIRGLLARRLGISEDNDFALLAAIGGECAGALWIGQDDPPSRAEEGYRDLPKKELEAWIRMAPVIPQMLGQGGIRLSLAGAQDKLPVLVEGDRFHIPRGSAPTSHIIKFSSGDFSHLPANEVFITLLARNLGLPAVEASLLRIGKGTACLVVRYDRIRDHEGRLVRLHQEDLCQALGLGPRRKYEAEGGPSFARCFSLIQESSSEPLVDTGILLEWMVFNVLAGNADGHAKNLAIVYEEDGKRRLSPLYDLVCTRAYKMLDRRLAMAVGSTSDPGAIGPSHFIEIARMVGVQRGFLIDLVDRMVDRMPEAVAETSKRFTEMYGDSPALQMVKPVIQKQVRRLRLARRSRA